MLVYKTRKEKLLEWGDKPTIDSDGFCLRHNQKIFLEPCHECEMEMWDDLEHEKFDYKNLIIHIATFPKSTSEIMELLKQIEDKYEII